MSPNPNSSLDSFRVNEAAALNASRWMSLNKPEEADLTAFMLECPAKHPDCGDMPGG